MLPIPLFSGEIFFTFGINFVRLHTFYFLVHFRFCGRSFSQLATLAAAAAGLWQTFPYRAEGGMRKFANLWQPGFAPGRAIYCTHPSLHLLSKAWRLQGVSLCLLSYKQAHCRKSPSLVCHCPPSHSKGLHSILCLLFLPLLSLCLLALLPLHSLLPLLQTVLALPPFLAPDCTCHFCSPYF